MEVAPQQVTPPGPAARWLPDTVVALVVSLVNAATASRFIGGMELVGRALLVGSIATVFAALLLRRPHPIGSLAATIAATLVVVGLGVPLVVVTVAPLVVVHAAAAGARTERAWAVLAAAATAAFVAEGLAGFPNDASTVAGNLAALGVAWLLGNMSASRQRYVDALEQRTAELEAARTELAARAVEQERLRIARELHDVVAHALSVVTVRAGVAAHVAADHPEEAASALAAIETAGRAALGDMRRMVGLLRQGAPSAGDSEQRLSPQPGLADLAALVAGLADAGPAITLRVDVEPDTVDDSVGLTTYRIVQESLTNAVRHAAAAHVTVQVTASNGWLRVEVADDGRGGPVRADPEVAGHGLRGIHERVGAHGGAVTAGPGGGGGFIVAAELPTRSGALT